jgi:hypothetical protein
VSRCEIKTYGMVRVKTGGSLNRTVRCPRPATVLMVPNPRSDPPGKGELHLCETCADRIEHRGVWAWCRATQEGTVAA